MSDTSNSAVKFTVVIEDRAGYVVDNKGRIVAMIETMTIERGSLAALLVSGATESFCVTAHLKRLAQ
jgi:hypothetical protein